MDANELLVISVFLLEHIVPPVDFPNPLHHFVHIAKVSLYGCNVIPGEAFLLEVCLEILGEADILVFLFIKAGIEFSFNVIISVYKVIIDDFEFFLTLESEIEFEG